MPVNLTERGLPYGYQPEDFGQVGVSRNAAGTGSIADDCFLISYFTSPITINYRNTYVVMFKDLHDDTQSTLTKDVSYYVWTVEDIDKETDPIVKGPVKQKHGVFEYTPPNRFLLCITVEIYNDNDVLLRSLIIEQKVDKLNNELEMLIKSPHSSSSFSAAGRPFISRNLLNNYMPHIRGIYKSDNDEYKIPRRLLSASIFNNLYSSSERRADWLEEAADELNRDDDTCCYFTDYAMGLNRISPQLASMILCDRSTVNKTSYTKWIELPESRLLHKKITKEILDNFKKLGEKKVEIFNFIRFPKSNISLLYKLLNKLKQRTHRYPKLKTNDFLYDDMAPKVVYQEYRDGYGSQIHNSDVIIGPYELIKTMNHPVMGLIDPLSDYEARNVICIADKDTGRIIETRDTKNGLFKKCNVPTGEHYGIDVDKALSSDCKHDYNIIVLDVGYWGHFENTQRDFGMIENNHVWLCRLNSWNDPESINKNTIDLFTAALCGNDRKNIASEFVRKLQSEWGQAVELVSHTEIDKLPPDLVLPNDQLTIAFPDLHLPEKLPDFPQKEDFHTNLRARKILRNELRLCQHSPPPTSIPTIPMDREKQIEIQKHLYDLFYGSTRINYSVMDDDKVYWFSPKQFLAEKALVDRKIGIECMWFYEREAAWEDETFYDKNKNDPKEFEKLFYCKPTAAIDLISVLLTIKTLKQQRYNIKTIQVGDLCEMWMNNEWLYRTFPEKFDYNFTNNYENDFVKWAIAWIGTDQHDEYQYRLDPFWKSITGDLMTPLLRDLENIAPDIPKEIDSNTFFWILSQLEQKHKDFVLSVYIAPTSIQNNYKLKPHLELAQIGDLANIFLSIKHALKPYIFHKWPDYSLKKLHKIGNEINKAETEDSLVEIGRAKTLVKNRMDNINSFSLPFEGIFNQKECFKKFLSRHVLGQRWSTDFVTNARGQKEYFWNECILKLFNEVECKMIYGNHDGYRGDSKLNQLLELNEKAVPWICEDGIWAEHGHRWDVFNRDGMAFGAGVTNLVYYYNEGILSLDRIKENWPINKRQFHEEFLPGYVQWSMIINGCIPDVVDNLKRDKKIGNFAVQIVGHTHSPDLLKIKIKKGRSN